MKTVIYMNSATALGEELSAKLLQEIPEIEVDVLHSFSRLSKMLGQPLNGIVVTILLIHHKEELTQFKPLMPLFDRLRLILVLPDRSHATLSMGIQLKPAFVSYLDNDWKDITSVVKKIKLRTDASASMYMKSRATSADSDPMHPGRESESRLLRPVRK